MSLLPHFLSPIPAAIAAAIAIPLLLLLYFLKLRRREVAVSSTFLWKKAIQDLQVNAPFQKLRKNLLLLLQLLALLALILALSRPVSNYTPGAGKLTVILIDHSASMNATDQPGGHSRLDEAKRRAKELVGTMGRNAQATVIAFADHPMMMQTFTGDGNALRNAIDRIEPTDRPTRLSEAYQLADAQAVVLPDENRVDVKPDVRLYSDGRVTDGARLQLHGDLKYEPIGSDQSTNVGIVSLDAKRDYDQPTQVQVFARLANFGPKTLNADVQLTVDGAVRSVAAVSLAPQRWDDPEWSKKHPGEKDDTYTAKDSVNFSIDMPTAGVVRVEQMHKDGDTLAADDAAEVIVPPPKSLSVLLVTEGNYFLERALHSMSLSNPVVLDPATYESQKSKHYDVVMFDKYAPQSAPPGNYIYFGAAPLDAKLHAQRTGEQNDTVDDVGVLDWQRENPMLRHLTLDKLYAASMLKLDVPLQAVTLVDGLKGPMVVLDREQQSTYIVVAFDLLQSNWPLKISFPIFLHNALQYLALGSEMNVRPSYSPGDTIHLPRQKLADYKSIRLTGPGGRQDVPVPPAGDMVLPTLEHVGVYKTDPAIPQYEQLASNLLDPNESNTLPADVPPGDVGSAVAVRGGGSRFQWWWWLIACGALPMLMVEWWVYTRRVHL